MRCGAGKNEQPRRSVCEWSPTRTKNDTLSRTVVLPQKMLTRTAIVYSDPHRSVSRHPQRDDDT